MTTQAPFRTIELAKGKGVTLVDEADYEWAAKHKWYLASDGYVQRATHRHPIAMHRLLLNAPSGIEVDHKNGDRTDNRRCNLRLATDLQQAQNRRKPRGATWKYKGVELHPSYGYSGSPVLWRATITVKGKRLSLGVFESQAEAARAYDRAAVEHFGEFACLNFPQEGVR